MMKEKEKLHISYSRRVSCVRIMNNYLNFFYFSTLLYIMQPYNWMSLPTLSLNLLLYMVVWVVWVPREINQG